MIHAQTIFRNGINVKQIFRNFYLPVWQFLCQRGNMAQSTNQILTEIHRHEIGQRLCAIRSRSGLTQAQFAELIGTTGRALVKWELGMNFPDLGCLPPLCARFNVNLEYVVAGIDDRLEKAVALELEQHLGDILARRASKGQKTARRATRKGMDPA
jgi:transcriptional regulator with XRE-family HTH domain